MGKVLPKERHAILRLATAATDRELTEARVAAAREQRAAEQTRREVEARQQETRKGDSDVVHRLWPLLDVLQLHESELLSRAAAARLAQLAVASAGRLRGLSGHRRNGPAPDVTHLAEALEVLVRPHAKSFSTTAQRMSVCTAWARALTVFIARPETPTDADGDTLRNEFLAQLGCVAPDIQDD